MIYEKVLFVYTTVLKEGMAASGFYHPDAILFGVNTNETYPFVVTSGFISDSSKVYWNEIDITFDGKSVIDPLFDNENTFNILGSGNPNKDHYCSIASFYLKGIRLPSPGLYTTIVSLFDSDENGQKGILLDEKQSHFVVSGEFH